jgi:hypothetical protein
MYISYYMLHIHVILHVAYAFLADNQKRLLADEDELRKQYDNICRQVLNPKP